MKKIDVRSNTSFTAMLVSVVLMASLGLCACSSDGQHGGNVSSSSDASSGQIALNDNTSDAPVPLEKISVVVYNATAEGDEHQPIEGLAEHGAARLQEIGVEDVSTKNAAMRGPFVSYIAYRSSRYEQAAREIADELGIKGAVYETSGNSAAGYSYDGDIAVILCEDWALTEGLVDRLPENVQRAIDEQNADLPDGVR